MRTGVTLSVLKAANHSEVNRIAKATGVNVRQRLTSGRQLVRRDLTVSDRLTSLRRAPLIFKSAHSNVNGVRINANMRIDHTIRNTTNAKRPRLRTRVPANNTATLKL